MVWVLERFTIFGGRRLLVAAVLLMVLSVVFGEVFVVFIELVRVVGVMMVVGVMVAAGLVVVRLVDFDMFGKCMVVCSLFAMVSKQEPVQFVIVRMAGIVALVILVVVILGALLVLMGLGAGICMMVDLVVLGLVLQHGLECEFKQ